MNELKRLIHRTDKFQSLELSKVDDCTIDQVIIHLMKHHEKLESCLEDGEFIKLREFKYYDETEYDWQVYRQESDEEYQARLDEKLQQEQKERDRDLALLAKLSKKYPEIKIEL